MGSKCESYSRREFLKTTAFGLAMLAPAGRVLGANDNIRVAVIGLGGKGKQHAEVFSQLPGARLAALCDVDPKRLTEHVKRFKGVFSATDPRKVLERKDIDAVVIATPDHWHALLAIWACQAGRDVYVEKPVSHNIWEGSKIIEAGKKYGRIVQAGTQYRSDEGLKEPAPIYIENRNLPMRPGVKEMDQFLGIREGLILQCEGGYFAGLRGGGWVYDKDGKKIRQFKGDGGAQRAALTVHLSSSRNAYRERRVTDVLEVRTYERKIQSYRCGFAVCRDFCRRDGSRASRHTPVAGRCAVDSRG